LEPYRILSEEANAASRVKRDLPIMVVLGNPPYSGHSANSSWEIIKGKKRPNFIGQLLRDYYFVDGKPLDEKNPKWLQDDYVKFIRWGQWRIERTGAGVLAFITNHGYLDNPTFRGMRQQLMNTFNEIYILNLHGNTKKKECAPDGSKDENVFDIQQGVAIGIFIKTDRVVGQPKVHFTELWGTRQHKYDILSEKNLPTSNWEQINPEAPFYLFISQNNSLRSEYELNYKISEFMPFNAIAMNSHRDHFAIDFDSTIIKSRLGDLISTQLTDEELRDRYKIPDTSDFKLAEVRETLRQNANKDDISLPCLYRPFDYRFVMYHSRILDRPRTELNFHFLHRNNLGLITTRQTRESFSSLAVDRICGQHKIVAKYDGSSVFPLYIYPLNDNTGKSKQMELLESTIQSPGSDGRVPNLSHDFVSVLESRLGLKFVSDGHGDLKTTFGPEDVFDYIYAVFHSPTYRKRYAEFLKIDFPRVPLTSNVELFRKLCFLGEELVALHLLESPQVTQLITRYPVAGDNFVEKGFPKFAVYEEGKPGFVYINKTQYFEGVPAEVWEFHVGGYQVCEKWLKDRRGRQLSFDDLMHYQKVVVALKETIRLMAEIDKAIPGWPVE
jgi:predicted helicase